MNRTVTFLALASSSACGTYHCTPTTRNVSQAKPLTCEFDLLTTRPTSHHAELGVLESSQLKTNDAASFKRIFHDSVCQAGGDAVLVEVNAQGTYIRGTVIKVRIERLTAVEALVGGCGV